MARDFDGLSTVGRTGSGKSTLTLALLRCILTEGTVYYDGILTHSVNLDALRSNITIIPQVVSISFPFYWRCHSLTAASTANVHSPSCSQARCGRTWTCSASTTTRR